MFGRGKSSPVEELYAEQTSRDSKYTHDYEYRTMMGLGTEGFDLELNALARSGWDLVSFHVSSGSGTILIYGNLRRPRNP